MSFALSVTSSYCLLSTLVDCLNPVVELCDIRRQFVRFGDWLVYGRGLVMDLEDHRVHESLPHAAAISSGLGVPKELIAKLCFALVAAT